MAFLRCYIPSDSNFMVMIFSQKYVASSGDEFQYTLGHSRAKNTLVPLLEACIIEQSQ